MNDLRQVRRLERRQRRKEPIIGCLWIYAALPAPVGKGGQLMEIGVLSAADLIGSHLILANNQCAAGGEVIPACLAAINGYGHAAGGVKLVKLCVADEGDP